MLNGLLLLITIIGAISYYEEAPSVATLNYRCDIGDIDCDIDTMPDSFVAVADCSLIGKHGTITFEDGLTITTQVFDCSGNDGVDEDGVSFLTASGIAFEFDYASYLAYGNEGTATLEIYDE